MAPRPIIGADLTRPLSVRVGLWLIAFVLIVNAVLGVLLVWTRTNQVHQGDVILTQQAALRKQQTAIRTADTQFHRLVVCQVHHNTLTALALHGRDGAAKSATRAEVVLWAGVRDAIRQGNLTGHRLIRLIDAYLMGLGHLQATRYANPYPPGGLCDQLERKANP